MNNKLTYEKAIKEAERKLSYSTPNNFLYSQSVLGQQDFYPPADNRTWESYVEDIDEENSFFKYCEEFFELLDEEDYFEI